MALEVYKKKRNFAATPEPAGQVGEHRRNLFVVQKHDATRLHYDLRLAMDGVLKSWAVTKGPSLVSGEKRLAVHVEDHPVEYGSFEGAIPKGEYGGGTVILWDEGTWMPVGDAHKGYAKGHLEFDLAGRKLTGRWHLVRMQGTPGEKRENWLLIKSDDAFARAAAAPDILVERPESVKTGRMVSEVAVQSPGSSSKSGAIRRSTSKASRKTSKNVDALIGATPIVPDPSNVKDAKKAPVPSFIEPMLASLATSAPTGERWIHEIKFDGYRLQARLEAGRVRLLTRSGLDWTKKFGKAVVSALQELPIGSGILDGELVVETASGASDFSALQADLSEGRSDRFTFYAFDLLYLDGYDLRALALVERKTLLEQVVASDASGLLRYSGHFDESGAMVLRHACRLSLEGIVSKLRDAPYRTGRAKAWVKSKCSARQEFVIAGYVPSTVSRNAIGSLVLGVYEAGTLHHVGRVGTGFTGQMAEGLFHKLARFRIASSPFGESLTKDEARQVRYVQPELVAEVEFRAWTADGHLRHASFRGLREDKPAREIVRELPKSTTEKSVRTRPSVRLTHPDRVYWPEDGVTKEGLADYYSQVWRSMAPYVVGRPLALVRCPTGIGGETFFQKHGWKGMPSSISLVKDPKGSAEELLITIHDLDGMIGLVQSAVLEIHPWGSAITDWERPDAIVMDLDPGDDVSWQMVIATAEEIRQRLAANGLAAFVKTSGGKGLHVVSPLQPKAEWPDVKAFTKALADAMAADSPKRFVATVSKAKRRGKILIDYLRNQRGATAVAPYSTRARPGAAVSTPIAWDELRPGIGPDYFRVTNMPTRLAALDADPWKDFRAAAVPLETNSGKKRKAS